MTPGESTARLAAQLDLKVILATTRETILAEMRDKTARRLRRRRRRRRAGETVPATAPAAKEQVKLPAEAEKVLAAMKALAAASDGNVSVFLTDLQQMVAGGPSNPPIAFTLSLTDRAAAAKAIEELMKLGGVGKDEEDDDASRKYRKVTIRPLEDNAGIAVLKDRAILAFNDSVMKAAIDAALDKSGGLKAGGKQQKMTQSAGDGALVLILDMQKIVRLAWPFLEQAAQQDPEGMPLASLPSTGKMARMIGPEVLVIKPDADGLVLTGRGQIPLGGTLVPTIGMIIVRGF